MQIVECRSNGSNARRTAAARDDARTQQAPTTSKRSPKSASELAAAPEALATEREAAVLGRVRSGSSGLARSPLKASAMFYAKRFSRALGNRFLSVEGAEPSLPVRYGDLLQCLQEPQRMLVVRSLLPSAADEVDDHATAARHQQQQHPRLEKKTAAVAAKDHAEATTSQQQPASQSELREEGSNAGTAGISSEAAPRIHKNKKAPTANASAGRIALGRSLSKSAPAAKAAKSQQQQQSFVPIVTPLAGRPRQSRDAVATSAAAPSTIAASLDADDEGAVIAHPSTPQPSTPKEELPETLAVPLSTSGSAMPEAPDSAAEPASAGIRVPIMPLGDDTDTDADADVIGTMRAVSRASLTSTYISGGWGARDGDDGASWTA